MPVNDLFIDQRATDDAVRRMRAHDPAPESVGDRWFRAAATGDAEALQSLVDATDADVVRALVHQESAAHWHLSALELAVCAASDDATALLLRLGSDPTRKPGDANAVLTAARLGLEDVLATLLLAVAAANELTALLATPRCRTVDAVRRVGAVPLYVCGGQTVLHIVVEQRGVACLRALASTVPDDTLRALAAIRDNDGHTAGELAWLVGFEQEASAVLPWLAAAAADRDDAQREARNTDRLRRRAKRLTHAEAAERKTVPRELFTPDAAFDPADQAAYAFRPRVPAAELNTGEICDGVYAVRPFSDAAVAALRAEADRVAAEVPADRLRRPNSMNRAGFVIQDLEGFRPWLDAVVKDVLEPLACAHPDTVAVFDRKPEDDDGDTAATSALEFRSVHAFIIRYREGEDTELAMHIDRSHFTFNLCLGDDGFAGAYLYFHTARADGAGPDGAHLYAHAPGTAVIHRGAIRHGVHPLTSGARVNLVVWCAVPEGYYDGASKA
uniref:Fe2OG dioxygenase domain-containing protein n=1 Tax=Neobodo designis TaxID=312471 RepID=A0A7S1M0B7_NEODS|mmetsp:Transcript_31884/g.98657  ORF Transcript_31884/g.98657 Transcript_31884/m.98657 type:complete len:501 (+) Transcript_31884:43-1545(+)